MAKPKTKGVNATPPKIPPHQTQRVQVPIDKVDPAPWNPASRTTDSAIGRLLVELRRDGQQNPGHAIRKKDGRLEAIDCHRRRRCILILNVEREAAGLPPLLLDLIVHEGLDAKRDGPALWMALARSTRNQSALEKMEAAHRSPHGMVLDGPLQNAIRAVEKVFGPLAVPMMIERKASPNNVVRAVNWYRRVSDRNPGTPGCGLKKFLDWVCRHGAAKIHDIEHSESSSHWRKVMRRVKADLPI